jgi:ribose/xylose/arabinose/galactoside ABC-type transport system permease subunit
MTESARPSASLHGASPKRRLPRMQELGLLVVIAILYGILTVAGFNYAPPGIWNLFLSPANQLGGIAAPMSVYAIMAIGMTCVIVTGGIDISVGSIMGFCALTAASVLQLLPPQAPWYLVMPVAFFVPVAVGAFWGLVNGGLTVGLGVHPFIVTLGTLNIIRGLCTVWFPPTEPVQGHDLPAAFTMIMGFGNESGLFLSAVVVMAVVVGLGAIFLHALVAGRETYAIGGNAEAARFSGIRVGWGLIRVYILMGVCCGIAAMVHLGQFGTAGRGTADGYELMVIGAAAVGGASLMGGRGTALGALLGALVIALIENGISMMQWNPVYTRVIVGVAIILTAAVDRLSIYLAQRRAGRAMM